MIPLVSQYHSEIRPIPECYGVWYDITTSQTGRIIPRYLLCNMTRNYFEGEEYYCGMLECWNTLTLKKIMNRAENSEKQLSTTSNSLYWS
jgi:hypothetical protein